MSNILKLRSVFVIAACAALLIGLTGVRLAAQMATATILGTVTDPSGAVVPGATVRATNVGTGTSQSGTSDAQGRYRISALAIGGYEVQTEKIGFQTMVHKGVTLTVGGESVVDFALPVGQVAQTVTVEGEVTQVETTSSAISNLVEQAQIRDLPLNGRNFEQLIFLAPGVLPMTNISRGLFYGMSNAFSVAGIRPNGQAELLDDTDVMDYENRGSGAGVLGTSMGVDAIAEFQTLTNTYGAQFGGSGAVVNEVSKSGSNSFHGSAYEFLRNSALDARNFFDPVKIPEYQRNQFGAALGGPIKKDKMFFFVNYEGLRQRLGETQSGTILDANARLGIINGASVCPSTPSATCSNPVNVPGGTGYVNANVLPYLLYYNKVAPPTTFVGTGTQSYSQTATQPGTENYVLARYDWTIRQQDSMFVRYLGDSAQITEPFTGTFTLWPAAERNHNQFATVEEKHIFSPTLINTARFAFSRPMQSLYTLTSVPSLPGTPSGFQYFGTAAGLPDGRILISGANSPGLAGAFLGPNRQGPIHFLENKTAVGDDVIWIKGAHSLRFGGSITRIRGGTIQNSPGGGDVQFNSVTQFLQGTAYSVLGPLSSLTLTDGTTIPGTNGYRDFRENDYVIYAQDDWRVRPTFTLNIGLRYEPTSNPSCYASNNNATGICTIIAPPPFGPGATPCLPPGTASCSPIGTVVATGFSPTNHRVFVNNPSLRAIDPRIGFAWDPFKDHKTSIRGGYGIFQQLIAMRDYEVQYDLTPPFALATQYSPSFPIPQTRPPVRRQTPWW